MQSDDGLRAKHIAKIHYRVYPLIHTRPPFLVG